jgi:hypothetical protein
LGTFGEITLDRKNLISRYCPFKIGALHFNAAMPTTGNRIHFDKFFDIAMDKFIHSKNSHGKSKLKYGTLFLTRSQEPEPNYIMAPVPAKSFGSVGPASVLQHWFSASFLK